MLRKSWMRLRKSWFRCSEGFKSIYRDYFKDEGTALSSRIFCQRCGRLTKDAHLTEDLKLVCTQCYWKGEDV